MSAIELTILILVLNERDNIAQVLPQLDRVLLTLGCRSEVLVVDGGSSDGTADVARALGARVLVQTLPGYGVALREGFAAAAGTYVLTLDADLSHDPDFIIKLWRAREQADLVIASRYVKGGVAIMPIGRLLLSRVLNRFFSSGLGLPVRDLSSGFRLYRKALLDGLALDGRNFEILEEILVKAYIDGWRVGEIPFTYYPRAGGSSHARIMRFGRDLLRAFGRLWELRNSARSADYDERAFYSRIPLQRYWQRKRHRIITMMARGQGHTLDVGCGSSVILQSLNFAVGLDVSRPKLRYMQRSGVPLVCGSIASLPFRGASFDCVVCSQVIEHVPAEPAIFDELLRVLRPNGLLILGTPDYATIGWRVIEPLYGMAVPGAYHAEHISPYTRQRLFELARSHDLDVVQYRYVLRSELILAMRKRSAAQTAAGSAPASAPA